MTIPQGVAPGPRQGPAGSACTDGVAAGAALATVVEHLLEHARSQPTRTFCTLIAGGNVESITFGRLLACAAAYAKQYTSRGVRADDIVIIILPHGPHLLYSFLGAMLVGAIPSFMPFPSAKVDPKLYWQDHEKLFARVRPRLLVTYTQNFHAAHAALPGFAIPTLLASDDLLEVDDTATPCYPPRSASDIACLQHSSGTTGLKKGVMLSNRAILEQIASYRAAIDASSSDRIASWLPLYHDMGFIACFMLPLVAGIEIIMLDPFEWVAKPHILFAAIERYRATLCWLPNFAFSHLVRTVKQPDDFNLRSIRAFINCSEPCKPQTLQRFAAHFAAAGVTAARLQTCYAMAENVFGVTQTALGRAPRVLRIDGEAFTRREARLSDAPEALEVLSCGKPIHGVRIEVRTPSTHAGRAANIGEIHISGRSLFDGYHAQPELSGMKLRAGWYATGDLGFTWEDELFVVGRVDDMLILNGRNYAAHEIEALVGEVADIIPGRAIALGIDDDRSDATVLVVLAESEHAGTDGGRISREIRAIVQARIGIAIHSVTLIPRGCLVKTTSGKLSRARNKALFMDRAFDTIPARRSA